MKHLTLLLSLIVLFAFRSNAQIKTFSGHSKPLLTVDFSPSGKFIATAGKDKDIFVWDATSGELAYTLKGHENDITAVKFGKNDQTLISSSIDNTIRIWEDGYLLRTIKASTDNINSIAVHPNGRWLASGGTDYRVRIWDLETGGKIKKLYGFEEAVTSVAFSDNGAFLVAGGRDRIGLMWEASSGKWFERQSQIKHSQGIKALGFDKNGKFVASAGNGAKIKLWSLTSKGAMALSRTLKGHKQSVNGIAFSNDGKTLVSVGKTEIKIWDIRSGYNVNTKEGAHDKKITEVAFAPDGNHFVTVSEDNTVKLWDLNFTYNTPIVKNNTDNNTNVSVIVDLHDEINKINDEKLDLKKPTISWHAPYLLSSNVYNPEFQVKACIESNAEIKKVQLFLNGSSVDGKRGFKNITQTNSETITTSLDCDFTLEKVVKLKKGTNVLFIKASNINGNTISETYTINYSDNKKVEKRLALVIGNSNYKSGAKLPNPVHDAKAIAEKLTQLGFEVLEFEDLGANSLKRAIDEFGTKLKGKDSGLFYYAGHGIQVKGNNYLIPIDANVQNENEVEYDCIDIGRILSKMEAAKVSTNIVILDACRDNPFERSWSRGNQNKGLAFMNAPAGTLIAYATSPGKTASDGTGTNGLYTEALLQHIGTPGIPIEKVFKKVRITVEQKSNNKQIPWESTSLVGDFYFKR